MIISIIALIVSIISLVMSIQTYNKSKKTEQELKENYWNKGVVGRTINAKVGKDVISDSQKQDEVLPLVKD